MSNRRGQRGIRQIPDNVDLTAMFRGIRSDGDLDAAVAEMDKLLDEQQPTRGQRRRLDRLSDEVERYESKHVKMAPVTAAEMLKYLIEDAKQVTPGEVSVATGIDKETINEYLDGTREMTVKHKQVLARYFAVEPSVFDCGGKDD